VKLTPKICLGGWKIDRREREQSVLELLKDLRGLEPLKKLFWSELNYDRVNQPLSRRGWSQTAANNLAEDPILFAGGGQNNDFHVVYSCLPQDRLLLGQERPVVTQLLKEHQYGLFIFSNKTQDHWHFINVKYDAEKEKRRLFRRISISPEERLRTASERVAMLDLQSIQPDMFGLQPLTIQSKHDEAFDVEAVTKQFFEEYKAIFRILEDDLKKQVKDHTWAHDYSLQFLNRCMFIYFIQRKGWLGNDRDFLSSFWKTYQRSSQNSFVDNWLKVLFFEAFNNKFHGGHDYFPAEIREALSLAPYLNGGLFTESRLDQEHKATISDRRFEQILRFLERYNFTIAEDSPLDKEVAVDPEMIGKVYESLVNVSEEVDERGEAGIFYTPRTEIDLMCRLSLVDHLANHLGNERKELLNQLVFALEPDEKTDADRAVAGANLWPTLNERLRDITVLDPACGSGSFLVGILNILDDLQERANRQLDITEASYELKKRIIGQSLYGVDVMEWACHVAELRLWLALIIDVDFTREELHVSREPLLPHFSFKVRCGDSLVQEVGSINLGHIAASQEIPPSLKARITALKDEKLKFYNNDTTCRFPSVDALKNEEKRLFSDILDAREHAIQERVKALQRKLEGPQTYQIGLDGKGAPRPHQMDLEANQYRQEIEAQWILKWKDWLLYEDEGLKEITRRMRALQVPTCSEKGIWRESTIRGILTNPTIAGITYAFTYDYEDSVSNSNEVKRRRGKLVRRPREEWVEIPRATPAIISKAEFEEIQQKLAQNRSNPRRKAIGLYWLQSHVVCGLCGRRYRVKSNLVKSRSNPHYVYYYECPCGDRFVSPDKCSNHRWNRDKLQDLIWEKLRAFLLNPEAVIAGVEAIQDNAAQENYCRQELREVERALRGLDEEQWSLLQQAKRGFPEEMVEADNKRINESHASLMQRKADLEDKITRAAQAADNMTSIEQFCQLVRHNIDNLTDEDKKLAVKALDVKVRVYPDTVNIEGIIPILDDVPSDYLTSRCSE